MSLRDADHTPLRALRSGAARLLRRKRAGLNGGWLVREPANEEAADGLAQRMKRSPTAIIAIQIAGATTYPFAATAGDVCWLSVLAGCARCSRLLASALALVQHRP